MTLISKCTKWNLRGTYLNFFPDAAWPQLPLEAHVCDYYGHGYNGAGISEAGILKI